MANIKKRKVFTFDFKPFSEKQLKVLNWWAEDSPVKDRRMMIADGSIRSGKTTSITLSFILYVMENFNHQNVAIAGKSVGAVRRNILQSMQSMLLSLGYEWIEHRSENYIEVIKGEKVNYVYIFGLKDATSSSHIQGLTLAGAFIDEAVVADEDGFNQLLGRCSVEGSKIWISCNPESPYHWFYRNFIKQAKHKNILYIHFTMDDNPSLSEEIKTEYKRMFSGVWAKRFIEGRWACAEGVIYDMFNDSVHIIDYNDIPYENADKWCIGVDYGTGNATTWLLLMKDKDGVIYAVDEYYFAGRKEAQEAGNFELQKTDLEYTEDMREFILEHNDITYLTYRNIDIMVDPAASSFIVQMRRFHMRSKKANNEVLDGIRTVATMFADSKLFVSNRCKNLIEEIHSYSWDDKAQARGIDSPQKINDHCVTGDILVKTIDGYKKIEDLVGTEGFVCTIDSNGNTVQKRYYDVRKTRENAKVITLVFENGEELTVTPDHLILTDLGWCEAQFLSKHDNIITLDKSIKIIEKKKYQICDVYNMEVEDVHCFAVTNSDIIIHNCCDALRYGCMKLKDKNKISKATRNLGL